MAKTLPDLRREAKRLGVKGVKGMDRSELEAAIAANGSASKSTRKRVVKKATRGAATSAPAKKKTAKRQATAAAKTTTRTDRAGTTRKPARQTTQRSSAKAGRNVIGSINFSKRDGWNPRAGSPVERIFKALVKRRGNTEKVFDDLVGSIKEFVPRRKSNGENRTKAEMESFLRYRINRVRFDFAVATGQHKPNTNRAKYGTGGTGRGVYKRGESTKVAATRTRAVRKQTKEGAPAKKATRKATAKKGAKRGRPKGSKNKKK